MNRVPRVVLTTFDGRVGKIMRGAKQDNKDPSFVWGSSPAVMSYVDGQHPVLFHYMRMH